MSFAKLDSGITMSSIWSEPLHIRVVWVAFLSLKDENGLVSGVRSSLQRICNVTIEQYDDAVNVLSSPDPESKTKDFDGRRISKCDEGWIILNHEKYRLHDDVQREKTRERVRKHREKISNVTQCNVTNTLPSVSVSTSESVSDNLGKDHKENPLSWRDSFDVYLAGCTDTYEHLLNNVPWIVEQERFHPNVDIRLSLEKAYKTFWGTEAGWKHKKRKRSKDIDWLSTFTSAISLNKVWKPKDNNRQSDFDRNWNAAMEQMNNESN